MTDQNSNRLNNEKLMGSEFSVFYKYAKAVLEEFSQEDFKNPEAWSRVIYKVMSSREK